MKYASLAIHGGRHDNTEIKGVNYPLYLSSTFVQDSIGDYGEFVYSRSNNPTMILANRIIVLGQSPSNIIFDVKIPDEKRTTRDSRFEDPESIKLRNELLRQINQDVEAHVQTVQ